MRRRVSGATPTVKDVGLNVVIVRQVPLMAIESPSWASERKVEEAGLMVRVVDVESFSRAETASLS